MRDDVLLHVHVLVLVRVIIPVRVLVLVRVRVRVVIPVRVARPRARLTIDHTREMPFSRRFFACAGTRITNETHQFSAGLRSRRKTQTRWFGGFEGESAQIIQEDPTYCQTSTDTRTTRARLVHVLVLVPVVGLVRVPVLACAARIDGAEPQNLEPALLAALMAARCTVQARYMGDILMRRDAGGRRALEREVTPNRPHYFPASSSTPASAPDPAPAPA